MLEFFNWCDPGESCSGKHRYSQFISARIKRPSTVKRAENSYFSMLLSLNSVSKCVCAGAHVCVCC